MDERTLDGVVNRYVSSEGYEIESSERIVVFEQEDSASHKSQVVANKISERGENAFVNPIEEGYEVVIRDV